jgi:hypothetical protein
MLDRPIFVIGCGQSGTSILGRSLGAHPDVAYLHERSDLWIAAFPEADIWTAEAGRRGGKIRLDERDYTPARGTALRRAFASELAVQRRPRLCEKLPINAFRLRLVGRVFPDARFVYISRDGIEVARSIAWMATARRWFGVGDVKWRRLSELAETFAPLQGIAAECRTPFHMGLLEWVLSTAFAEEFFRHRANAVVAIRYETLAAAPIETLATVIDRCGLPPHDGPGDFFRRMVPPERGAEAPTSDVDLTQRLLAIDRAALFAPR